MTDLLRLVLPAQPLTGIALYAEVRVFDVNGARAGQPEDGWPGTVVNLGRKLMTVTWRNGHSGVFRIGDGSHNNGQGHLRVRTVAQVDQAVRAAEGMRVLRQAGLTAATSRAPDPELVELLAVTVTAYAAAKAARASQEPS
jgi:hypothetical protein